MSINRYRLRHLADSGHRPARLLIKLLSRPDRILGIILLGNNFVNFAASFVAAGITFRIFGSSPGVDLLAILVVTITFLIFAEVGPKTLAALHPERVAFPAGYILKPLLSIAYPLVWLINAIANQMLRLLGVPLKSGGHQLSSEELRAAVLEAGALIPESHQNMLLGILDLEKVVVDDVMIPRNRIVGIDLDQEWDDIIEAIVSSRYTRIPIYHGSLDNMVGILHLRNAINMIGRKTLTPESLEHIILEPYYIPSGTSLNTQLINFRKAHRRRGLVVDEYGDILGLVTLEEILEEIVGEFTTRSYGNHDDVRAEEDGTFIVRGAANLRDINRLMGWSLPTSDNARTVNGLIIETLEHIPEIGTSLMIAGYTFEIMRTRGTAVDVARITLPAAIEEHEDDQSSL